jgi:uncharacterized membrane protein HdeD (DUF308 family)
MSLQAEADALNPRVVEKMHLAKHWMWFLALGIALIALGAAAIGAAFITTLATVLTFGCLLLAGGVVQVVNALVARSWRGCSLHLLSAALHLILGVLMIERPERAAEALTLMLAVAFLAGGVVRIIFTLREQFPGWSWVLLNGVVTFLLGIAIWRQWPASSFWVIGTFVGIDLIFNGWSWVMLALAVKAAPAGTR